MNKPLIKGLILGVGVVDLTVSVFFTLASWKRVASLPAFEREVASVTPGTAHGTGHGAPAANDGGNSKLRPWVSLDEMFVNVLSGSEEAHTVAFKLEVELFDERTRPLMDERQAVVKNAIIEVARQQPYDGLDTMAGKLYFKEALVGRVNQTLQFPLIRDVHLASFTLR
jgi:flagellar basal body-associated protein FliL